MLRGGTVLAAGCLLLALAAAAVAQPPKQKAKAKADNGPPQWVREPVEGKHLHYVKFPSKAIGGEVSYVIYRPTSYDADKVRRYPVVYWLHGIGGSQAGLPRFAERLDAAIEGGKAPPMLVVFANGVRNSFYCDATDGSRPVETTIVKELVPHIDQTCRTVSDRSGRMIEGFSMGGFGAAHLGFKYPDVFGSVSILDAAMVTADVMAQHHAEIYQRMFRSSKEAFDRENPWLLAEKNVAAIRGKQTVRLIVGALRPGNQRFHELMTRLAIPHEYEVFADAGHNYPALYDQLGEKNWAFYRKAFGSMGP